MLAHLSSVLGYVTVNPGIYEKIFLITLVNISVSHTYFTF